MNDTLLVITFLLHPPIIYMTNFLYCRQYKDVVGEEERYNLKDVIHKKNEFSDLEEIDILQVGKDLLLQYIQ